MQHSSQADVKQSSALAQVRLESRQGRRAVATGGAVRRATRGKLETTHSTTGPRLREIGFRANARTIAIRMNSHPSFSSLPSVQTSLNAPAPPSHIPPRKRLKPSASRH